MFYFESKDFESNLGQNTILSKKIEIDKNLDCFIIIDGNNSKIITPILNKIVDFILDNITTKDTYNKFLVTLESINYFINSIRNKEENEDSLKNLNILIGILEKNTFHFSKIGEASSGLINNKKEFVEISDRTQNSKTFDYISSGKLQKGEKIIISNNNFFINLTTNDLEEISKLEDNSNVLESIVDILNDEKSEENSKIQLVQYELKEETEEVDSKSEKIKDYYYKAIDNNFIKTIIAYFMILKEKIDQKSKIIKNLIFLGGIGVSTFLLFYVISGIVGSSIQTSQANEQKTNLIEARNYVRIASDNLANDTVFENNIQKAEDLLDIVREKNLFLSDIDSIEEDISIVKKQYYGIELFDDNNDNIIYRGDFEDGIKVLEDEKKLYVVTKNAVYGPIISGQQVEKNLFDKLQIDDEFIDAQINGSNIVIITKDGRVVNYNKNGTFSYSNVLGQSTWQKSDIISTYNLNLYMLNEEGSQIYKHTTSGNDYMEGTEYLKQEDSDEIGKILNIGIDGGIYILNGKLEIYKYFSRPYSITKMNLVDTPNNYISEGGKTQIITGNNLGYFYLYLNNKIWIFEPNSSRYLDVKSLTYIGQIEAKNSEIKSFYVPRDGEIDILTDTGIHKITFEVNSDNDLILR